MSHQHSPTSVPRTEYLTDRDVAALFGITLERLRNKISAGCPLPPRIEPPGSRQRLWPRSDLEAWLAEYTVSGAEGARVETSARSPGRPRKRRGGIPDAHG